MPLPHPVRRVVSLVPSLTEAVALTAPELIVGCTDWCVRPADLDARAGHVVTRVRGTKNPNLTVIASLRPDLVIANQEENRRFDVERLRAAGLAVWVTRIDTVDDALRSLERLATVALGQPLPGWLAQARANWELPDPPIRAHAVVCVWRDPWMVVGPRTYAADVLRRSGIGLARLPVADWEHARYPRVDPGMLHPGTLRANGTDVVMLLDAPYPFGPADGPECFAGMDVRIVPERPVAWYGPGMVSARAEIATLLS